MNDRDRENLGRAIDELVEVTPYMVACARRWHQREQDRVAVEELIREVLG